MTATAHIQDGMAAQACPLCEGRTAIFFRKPSAMLQREFVFHRCAGCGFIFVGNPCLDFEKIYNEAYYAGRGADRLVNYLEGLDSPLTTLRSFEWSGIAMRLLELTGGGPVRVLDYGCGNGCLAEYLSTHGFPGAQGWDVGWIRSRARDMGKPVLDQLPPPGSCDAVTAVEVIEHSPDPLAMLREIRSLLKPGGILFLTTGNAAPWTEKFGSWSYVIPEVHLSYFTPGSLSLALEKTGFTAAPNAFSRAWKKILVYKILKNLRFRRAGAAARLAQAVPSPCLRFVDRQYGVTAMPYGIAH